jgi:predicted ATP-grasp superfamily ATP-dependent carboligase
MRCKSKEDVDRYFSNKNNLNRRPFLVQEYVPGHDVCASVLAKDGKVLCWTIQIRDPRGGVLFIEHPDILQAVRRICANLHYSGLAHFDLRMEKQGGPFRFLECNPRFWGTLTASTFAGVNFAVLGISTVLQRPELPKIKYQTGLCLPDQVIEKSLIRLFLQKQISFDRNAFRYLAHVLCDSLVLAERLRKRLAKIFIPGKIRHRRPKLVIPPLSALDTTPPKKKKNRNSHLFQF